MDEWARVQIETLTKRVADLEQQVFGGVKGPPGPESDPELQQLLAAGDKLRAIKRYVDLTGSDLSAAKAAVERMAGG
jgi:ribosomal protein L7/L12